MSDTSLRAEAAHQLLPEVPVRVLSALITACQSRKWLCAVFRVENDTLHLERTATDFPVNDIDQGLRMLVENLEQLKQP